MSTLTQRPTVIGGVDTHKATHHAAAIDATGRLLGDQQFPATTAGHRQLLSWLLSFGDLVQVGVEGTGSYGAALTRILRDAHVAVVEVNRPNQQTRRGQGKSDRLDAEQAARAVLATTARSVPKTKAGPVEVIRILRIARSTAVKARTQAMNAIHAIVVSAPDVLREDLIQLRGRALITGCAHLRPETTKLIKLVNDPDRLLLDGTKTALQDLALRWVALDTQIKALTKQLTQLTQRAAPALVALPGVGPEIAGQLLITAGDNADRIDNEAAFARLCGVAPQPASSGRTTGRHRLSRSGDRAANSALYMVAITRMRRHEPTRAYIARRTQQGLSKREILRCLKRYIAREVYAALPPPRSPLDTT
jgi:transposase